MAAPPLTPSRRTTSAPPAAVPAPAPAPAAGSAPDGLLLVAVLALLAAACLPLGQVFVGTTFVRPVAAALLLSVGLSWVTRRAGGGPLVSLLASAAGFGLLVCLAFLPHTLAWGVVPTWASVGAARDLWAYGMELVQTRPSPAFPEDGLLLLTITGVWWVAHVVEGLVFRLDAPLRAVGMALLLWTVPLALAPADDRGWSTALPLLLAAALLLLAAAGGDLTRWGRWTSAGRRGERRRPLLLAGWPVAFAAIAAGAVLGSALPGADEPPWYQLRGSGGGSTLTTNPIVSLRSNLVALGREPVARVTSPQPVYLRLTALDVYSEQEEWRSDGIRAGDAGGRLPFERPIGFYRELDVDIEVQGLPGGVIVPVPYHPSALDGPAAGGFRYDPARATVTRSSGNGLAPGDRYRVTAAVPAPPPDLLAQGGVSPSPALTALPGDVPPEVADLARRIVEDAGAVTAFDQALAVQEELRSWTYSLDPPQGHGSSAMLSFITERIGYCEQFAGTMAVMLRTLGIPARVAVGYTPGDLVDAEAGVYQVRNANAHAWVEVLFDELGWIAFEPTPRTDGNVLVPSPVDLAPTQLESELAAAAAPEEPAFPERDDFTRDLREDAPTPPPEQPEPELPAGAGASADGDDGDRAPRWPLALLLLVGLTGSAGVLATRRRTPAAVPSAVVLDAVARVERLAGGLGRGPGPSETDAEFLRRVAPGSADGEVLARAAERARWSPTVPAEDADAAARAAAALCEGLVDGRGRLGRAAVRWRAAAGGARESVRRRVRH